MIRKNVRINYYQLKDFNILLLNTCTYPTKSRSRHLIYYNTYKSAARTVVQYSSYSCTVHRANVQMLNKHLHVIVLILNISVKNFLLLITSKYPKMT